MSGSERVGDTCRRHLPQFVVGAFAEQPIFLFKLIDPLVFLKVPLVLQINPLLLLMQLLQNHFQLDTWRIRRVVGHCLGRCDSPPLAQSSKQAATNGTNVRVEPNMLLLSLIPKLWILLA